MGSAGAEQIGHVRNHAHAVLVFGPRASATDVTASLDAIAREAPHTSCKAIVLAARESLEDFQQLVDGDRLFYLAGGDLSPRDLDSLMESALGAQQPPAALDRFLNAASLRRIAVAQSIAELAAALRAAAANAVAADRTRCVFVDRERDVLWVPGESAGESMAAGLAGFIVRTGGTVCLPRLDADARFDRGLDDPDGNAGDRFLGVPVRAGGTVVAVLAAMRSSRALPFEPLDVAALEALAAHASPYAAVWLGDAPDRGGPFRHLALRAAEQPSGAGQEPLRLDSSWMRRATWLFFGALGALLAALVVVKGWLG